MPHARNITAYTNSFKVSNKIAEIVGRPAQVSHVGEYIASAIFDIELHKSATHKVSDGHFTIGNLKGCTVNIKWYLKHESLLDLNLEHFPDYYLVLTGPKAAAVSSRGATRPRYIEHVFLFNHKGLIDLLQSRGVKIGIATSLRKEVWLENEIFPTSRNKELVLTLQQQQQLALFKG